MKYIDSEKLIAEIDRRIKILEPHKDTFESCAACRQELIWMKEHIASLQHEQPEVNLEKEIDKYLEPIEAWQIQEAPFTSMENIARHFAEWGAIHLNARKEE